MRAAGSRGLFNIDALCHGIERMDPARSLRASTDAQWLDGTCRGGQRSGKRGG